MSWTRGIVARIIKAHRYFCPNLANISELNVEDLKRIATSAHESEDRFAKVFSSSPNMVAVTSLDRGKFIDINESFSRFTGYAREEVIGRRAFDIGIWAYPQERDKILRKLKKHGRVYNEEVSLIYKSGQKRTCLFSGESIIIGGKPCMVSVAADITERKLAEEALRESEEFSTSLLENAPNPITVVYPDTTIKYVNPAFERLTGFFAAEVVGTKAPYPWWPEERRAHRTTGLRNFMVGGAKITEQHIQNKAGEILLIEINMVRIMHDGKFRFYLAHWNNITEKRKTEEAMRESEEKFSKAFRASPDVIFIKRVDDGRFLDINDNFHNVFGYTREEVIGRTATELGSWVKQDDLDDILRIVKEQGRVANQEVSFRSKSGAVRSCLLSAEVVNFSGDQCLLSVVTDITERKRAGMALLESEEKYRDLFENTSELIQSVTPEGNFRYVNNGWKHILGYSDEDIAGMTLFDIIDPECLEQCKLIFQQVMAGEEVGLVEAAFISKSGNKVIIEGNVTCKFENGKPLYTRGIFRDITKRKYLERDVSRLASAVSMSTDCIVITDFDARVIDINQRTMELYGAVSKDELLGKHFLELIDPSERGAVNMDVKTIIETGNLESREYLMLSKDGRGFAVRMTTSLVKDADGQPMGIVRVGKEISQPGYDLTRVEAERAARCEVSSLPGPR